MSGRNGGLCRRCWGRGAWFCLWLLPQSHGGAVRSQHVVCPWDELVSVLMAGSSQRQRLRELLIRQQIQRNSLRQEKESAAAAATSSPAAWATDASNQPFELGRGMAPFPAVQVGELGAAALLGSRGGQRADAASSPPSPGQRAPWDTGHRGRRRETAGLRHGAGSVRTGRAALPAPAGCHAGRPGHQREVSGHGRTEGDFTPSSCSWGSPPWRVFCGVLRGGQRWNMGAIAAPSRC